MKQEYWGLVIQQIIVKRNELSKKVKAFLLQFERLVSTEGNFLSSSIFRRVFLDENQPSKLWQHGN